MAEKNLQPPRLCISMKEEEKKKKKRIESAVLEAALAQQNLS